MNEIVKNITGLQIHAVNKVKFTKGQVGLLKVIKDCIANNKPLDWDIIVDCYYNNVRKTSFQRYYKYIQASGGELHGHYEGREVDVKVCYAEKDSHWQYTLRSLIRQWFVSTIGILVIKNQLIVIPVINIEDEPNLLPSP